MIRDKINQILDSLPVEELENVYWSIESIHKEYLFKKNLLEKGASISTLVEEAVEITEKWDKSFAKNISDDVKENIYYNQFKWHIFSYEKQECLIKEEARKAFDTVFKDELYVMYQGLPMVFLYSKASDLVAKDFDSQQDIYIFDKNYTWTYVHTHESMCGPYFYSVK